MVLGRCRLTTQAVRKLRSGTLRARNLVIYAYDNRAIWIKELKKCYETILRTIERYLTEFSHSLDSKWTLVKTRTSVFQKTNSLYAAVMRYPAFRALMPALPSVHGWLNMNLSLLPLFLAACLFSSSSQSGLIDRGNGMIYDDILEITWLQDANFAATQYTLTGGLEGSINGALRWASAKEWVQSLDYGGFDDWRLPSAGLIYGHNPCPGYHSGTCDRGFNNVSGELGHLFYHSLGNKGWYDIEGT